MWQHVKLSEQARPRDTLACCWDVKQPTNNNALMHTHNPHACRHTHIHSYLTHTRCTAWTCATKTKTLHYPPHHNRHPHQRHYTVNLGPYAPQGSTSLRPKLSVTSKVSAPTSYAWVGSRVHFRSSEDVTLLEFTSPIDRE